MTPLAAKLAVRIRANGPMTVADYMAACLGDPEHGYYLRREPFGRGGDFITAPEISQVFGELIGLWALSLWQQAGEPAYCALVELGPGRGTLMADALRAARLRPDFVAALAVHLVETSPRLRDVQAQTLAASPVPVAWHDRLDDVPPGFAVVIANEFFDALPARQFIRAPDGAWAERMVGLDADGRLAFGLREAARAEVPRAAVAGNGPAVVEVSAAATAVMQALAARIVRHGGGALVIDYGYERPGGGDTLQAVRRHAYDDPLARPGEADITVHVDFGALAAAARATGASVDPLVAQGAFLHRLGIRERQAALSAGKDPETAARLASGIDRLVAEDGMGTLFKVIALYAPGLAPAARQTHPSGRTE